VQELSDDGKYPTTQTQEIDTRRRRVAPTFLTFQRLIMDFAQESKCP
jgi:hypothetical protein